MDYFLPLMTGHSRHQMRGRKGVEREGFEAGGRGGWQRKEKEKTGAEPRLGKGQVETNLSSARGGDSRKDSGEIRSVRFGSCSSFKISKETCKRVQLRSDCECETRFKRGSYILKASNASKSARVLIAPIHLADRKPFHSDCI